MRSIILLLSIAFSSVSAWAQTAPDALVKKTADEVLAIIKSDKDLQNGNTTKVVELAEAKVLPNFNFTRMTQLAVGKNWRDASPAQQEALTKEFRHLLVRTYSTSLSQYRNQTIDVKPAKVSAQDTDVMVNTLINQPSGQPVAIDYRMERANDSWKVYDVIVEGVSLVTNYRTDFANEVRKSGIDGLIKRLADRNAQSGKS